MIFQNQQKKMNLYRFNMKCVVCDIKIKDYGHNPDPLNNGKGRCCDTCNIKYVIPARIYQMREAYD